MADQGYIKISRKLFKDDPFWNEARPKTKAEAWLDLIASARFEASTELINGHVIEIQRGEIPASRRYLEKRWLWGGSRVSTFLKALEKMGRINQKQTNGQTILTLVNYSSYNDAKPQTKPLTNHNRTTTEPNIRKNKKYNPKDYIISLGVPADKADAWLEFRRKVKKASVSKVVVDGMYKVAVEAGMTLTEAMEMQEQRNWQGFKLDWIINSKTNNNGTTQTIRTTATRQGQVHHDFARKVAAAAEQSAGDYPAQVGE